MPSDLHLEAQASAYAADLYRYARNRVGAHMLRAWMIQRLMVDLGLDHDLAARTTEGVRRMLE